MKTRRAKTPKAPPEIVACDACLNWHYKGKHTATAAERKANLAARNRSGGYGLRFAVENPDIHNESLVITNDAGRKFLVHVVREGERYGLDNCLTHDENDPLVEFYDLTYKGVRGFGPRGQFVARYNARTLAAHKLDVEHGLCLDGGNADTWSIDATAFRAVVALARAVTA